jgi:mono/diheme cytochrome c family protein/plastocyanin
MTDQPGREPEQRLPARRPPAEAAPVERFESSPQVQRHGLTPERAAMIVRQSGNARWVAFLAVAVVSLFVILYYFYETGAPLGLTTPRLEAQADAQQVTAIERGYNLYEANCARCHGPDGEGISGGYIGPTLNDPMKLFTHLTPQYLRNVLTAGGRYVCGNANSLMPVWADVNGGPLNYEQIDDLIAFLRAPSTEEFVVRNPSLNEPVIGADGKVQTFTGWNDPAFKPAADATPVPACWSGGGGTQSQAPSESLPPDALTLEVTAEQIAFDKKDLEAVADQAFAIHFIQKDSGVGGHNIEIKDANGKSLYKGTVLTEPGETTYVIQALPAGTYTFFCSIHPIPAMTGTLTIK